MSVIALNPCIACGACCAFFRVSFYWAEADAETGGLVPQSLTQRITAHQVAMAGTAGAKPRCTALEGVIGGQVHCRIYAQRPSVCRDFTMAWENGEANQQCDKARAAWGLPPLSPPQPLKPDHHPHQSPAPKAA